LAGKKIVCPYCNKQAHTSLANAWKHARGMNSKRKPGGKKFTAQACPVKKGIWWHACGDSIPHIRIVVITRHKSKGFINRRQFFNNFNQQRRY